MRLPKFEYLQPKDIEEAVSMLQNEPTAKVLAGGTDLLVNMKHRVEVPSVVVNIKTISDLDFVRDDKGTVRIGALTTLKRIYRHPVIMEKLPALAAAASAVGSYHHQTMGTVAGNLCQQNRCKYFNQSRWWRSAKPVCLKVNGDICHVVSKKETCYSSYCGDIAPVLLVMNANVVLAGSDDSREIPIGEFFSGDGITPLNIRQGEILTEVVIPELAWDGCSSYIKFANRESIDFPIVGSAFWASREKKEYRVAFTAVERKPLRALEAEAYLAGKDISPKTLSEASALISKGATVVKNSVYSPSFKRRMMGALLQRTAEKALGRT